MSQAAPLRVAILSTPRSGNTWVRETLSRVCGVTHLARHALADGEWDRLPRSCILQIHWRREAAFVERLRRHGFRVLVLARHPFDVLVSILHVAVYGVESEHWLGGRHGDERCLFGAMPRSRAFLDYATGPRAAELLAVSRDWWDDPDAVRARYEDLVADPEGGFGRLAETFGATGAMSAADALAETSIASMRRASLNNHFWKGKPGLWRELLPAAEAGELASALRDNLDHFRYSADADPDLDASRADANWVRLAGEELHQSLRRSAADLQPLLDEMSAALAKALFEADVRRQERDGLRAEIDKIADHLARFEGLTGTALRVARGVQRVIDRVPGLTRRVKRLFGRPA